MTTERQTPASPGLLRAVIADDHVVVRTGLTRVLESSRVATVVATAGSGDDLVQSVLDPDLRADFVIMDLGMPGGGIPLIESLRALRPTLRILVYSMNDEHDWAVRCMSAGANGYVSKSADVADLMSALTQLASGRRYVSQHVSEQLLDLMISGGQEAIERPHVLLSNREMDVFTRLARGESTGAIAEDLGLSPKTVSTYRGRVLEKLGLETNADLTLYAIRRGLIAS